MIFDMRHINSFYLYIPVLKIHLQLITVMEYQYVAHWKYVLFAGIGSVKWTVAWFTV